MMLGKINLKKMVKAFMQVVVIVIMILTILYLGINIYVNLLSKNYITTIDNVEPKQAVMVLGAHVFQSGNVSPILQDRLEIAIELYKKRKVKKILMSGDHGQKGYDEVNAMRKYAIKKGVPEADIFMDHAGFSTYESVYRAKYIFGLNDMIISTQEYHLKRAIFLAKEFNINASGISADLRPYMNMEYYKIRESIAVCKDFFYSILNVKPKYLGERIDITGDGRKTRG